MKKIFTFLMILFIVSFFSSTSTAQVVIKSSAENYVAEFSLTTAVDTLLRVRGPATSSSSSPKRLSFIRFDLTQVKGTATKALLRLTPERIVGGTNVINRVDFYAVATDSWDPATLLFTNMPALASKLTEQVFATQSSTAPKVTYDIDITDFVNSKLLGNKLVSIAMTDDQNTQTDARFYNSKAKSVFTGLPTGPVLSITGVTLTGIEDNVSSIPISFSIEQNYPNPFNPSTIITYHLPNNGFVDISIYNSIGQKISTLISDEISAGTHQISWNGKNQFGLDVSSGVYFAKVKFGSQNKTIKMLLSR